MRSSIPTTPLGGAGVYILQSLAFVIPNPVSEARASEGPHSRA